ncbi:MAG: hypothetical protein Q9221_005617 [Calogaya cf. arnoldii]
MSRSLLTTILLSQIALTTASPFQMSKRSDGFPTTPFESTTCGNNPAISALSLPTGPVAVDIGDCDSVINILCKWVSTSNKANNYLQHTQGTCEGHIFFPKEMQYDPVGNPAPDYAT